MGITRISVSSVEELKKISQMSKAEQEELKNWQDEYDEDCPPCSKEDLKNFKPVNLDVSSEKQA